MLGFRTRLSIRAQRQDVSVPCPTPLLVLGALQPDASQANRHAACLSHSIAYLNMVFYKSHRAEEMADG